MEATNAPVAGVVRENIAGMAEVAVAGVEVGAKRPLEGVEKSEEEVEAADEAAARSRKLINFPWKRERQHAPPKILVAAAALLDGVPHMPPVPAERSETRHLPASRSHEPSAGAGVLPKMEDAGAAAGVAVGAGLGE